MNDDTRHIEESVRRRFATLAADPASEKRFPVGPDSAKRLGYPSTEIDDLPAGTTASFAGVGNPFGLGALAEGMHVLDLGCGSGMDVLLASRRVGPAGLVLGVDLLPEMLARARSAATEARCANASFTAGRADALPARDRAVDCVLINGVLNLCVDKTAVLGEVFRVLKPGGRLQMADILLEPHVTPEELAGKGEWSD